MSNTEEYYDYRVGDLVLGVPKGNIDPHIGLITKSTKVATHYLVGVTWVCDSDFEEEAHLPAETVRGDSIVFWKSSLKE